MLGGATGAQADDLTGLFDAAQSAASLPSWSEFFQGIHQNWSDLPVRFTVTESLGYNSNVLAIPENILLGQASKPLGAFEAISSYGLATSTTWGIHQISFDASAGTTKYINHANLDTSQYSVHASDNWAVDRCAGSLAASAERSSSVLGQFVGYGGINNTTAISVNQSTRCSITGNYSANFNAGYSESMNSNGSTPLVNSVVPTNLNQLNNSQAIFVAAGISYSLTQTDSIQGLVSINGTHYPGRQNLTVTQVGVINPSALGLTDNSTQDSFNVTYTRQLQPDLSVVASLGVVGVTDAPFGVKLPTKIVPQYSLSLNWSPTAKLSFTAAASRSAGASTSVIANTQISETVNLGMTYQVTPKIGLSVGASTSYATSANNVAANSALAQAYVNYLTNQDTYSAHAGLSYTVTPFIGANLTAQYSRTLQPGATQLSGIGNRTTQSSIMFSVNYNPH
ncbi:MAG: outer membrane beta-barrel protein [Roseiarcus sp.]|uniref:outer membrane beta-barrel protein n=1 Tax=Roseiarcus sp. TaxID=1969460 RepID=UPI003C3ED889